MPTIPNIRFLNRNRILPIIPNIQKQISILSVSNKYLLLGTDCGTVVLTNIETNYFFPIKELNSKVLLSDFFLMDLFSFFNVKGNLFFYKITNLNFIQSFDIDEN